MTTARLGDKCFGVCKVHGKQSATIISASTNVLANGLGVARLGDSVKADCGHEGSIISASTTVLVNGLGVARLGDSIDGVFSGTIISASTSVSNQ